MDRAGASATIPAMRFGIECAAPTEAEAATRLTAWLEWQREHADALDALQQAERAYHRTIAGSAFANPAEGPTPVELQKDVARAVEAARAAARRGAGAASRSRTGWRRLLT